MIHERGNKAAALLYAAITLRIACSLPSPHSLVPTQSISSVHIIQSKHSRVYSFYEASGYMLSFKFTPNSSRMGWSSFRYSSYWPLFSTFALIPVYCVSLAIVLHRWEVCMRVRGIVPSNIRTAVG